MGDLESILNGSEEATETETEVTETEQVAEHPQQEAVQEEETGVEASQVAAETQQESEPDEVKGLRAAAAAERKKRQELEAEREAYRQELELARQQLAQRQHQEEEPTYIDEDVEKRLTATEAKLEAKVTDKLIMMSRELAIDRYPDYEEKEQEFVKLTRADPSLIDKMRASGNPALFAYKTANDHLQIQKLREIGDPVAYETSLRERIEAEVRAKITAELEAEKKAATEAAIRSKLPKSGFAEERSTGTARATQTFTGPPPLKDILRG